jgi:hypothetical protein
MSFFDLENELPGWLDSVIKKHNGFNEITSQTTINQLDHSSFKSYHVVCADKGNMVNNAGQLHQIWKFQTPKKNIRAYGKFLEYNGGNATVQFWIGLVVQDKIMNLYLWFGTRPPANIRKYLRAHLIEEIEKREYWYKEQSGNIGQISNVLTEYCGCGSSSLDESKLDELEKTVKKAISELLDAVEQAIKNIQEF